MSSDTKSLAINTVLCTRDGRKIGNAIIVGKRRTTEWFYQTITDYGTRVVLSTAEINELFHVSSLCAEDHKNRNMFYPCSEIVLD